jgi:hypothetical protein
VRSGAARLRATGRFPEVVPGLGRVQRIEQHAPGVGDGRLAGGEVLTRSVEAGPHARLHRRVLLEQVPAEAREVAGAHELAVVAPDSWTGKWSTGTLAANCSARMVCVGHSTTQPDASIFQPW